MKWMDIIGSAPKPNRKRIEVRQFGIPKFVYVRKG